MPTAVLEASILTVSIRDSDIHKHLRPPFPRLGRRRERHRFRSRNATLCSRVGWLEGFRRESSGYANTGSVASAPRADQGYGVLTWA